MKIVGLVSSFREGPMLEAALRSLQDLDGVLVHDGPVEGNPPAGAASVIDRSLADVVIEGAWETDAAKRTAMLTLAKRKWPGELWGLWLDGDEILLWGQYLRDWILRVSQQGSSDNPVGGWPLALVELDGTTTLCMGKLVRLDLIRAYLISSSYIELVNGDRRTVGNVDYWNPVDGPTQFTPDGKPHWRARPPLQGEPHLQHRPILRDRARSVERQHKAEARNFEGTIL